MRRILIIRLSAIGDIVMASGLIPALRARWPEAHIAWLAEPAGATLLEANPRLDEVIVWPRGDWQALRRGHRYRALAGAMRGFARELRGRRFDLVLDGQRLLKSGLWAWATRAPTRVGFASREGADRLMTTVLRPTRDDPRIGSEYRQMAAHVGSPEGSFRMDVALTDEDRRAARHGLSEGGVGAGNGYVVICPFTTRPQKHWFDEHWRALFGHIHQRLGRPCVVLGGPGDRAHAARLLAGAGDGVVDLTGRLGLRASAAVIEQADGLIGVDTGLTHMGTAFRRPTVALFGSTCPYTATDSPLTRVLYLDLWCSPCKRRPICAGAFDCMRLHRPGSVLGVLENLLAEAT